MPTLYVANSSNSHLILQLRKNKDHRGEYQLHSYHIPQGTQRPIEIDADDQGFVEKQLSAYYQNHDKGISPLSAHGVTWGRTKLSHNAIIDSSKLDEANRQARGEAGKEVGENVTDETDPSKIDLNNPIKTKAESIGTVEVLTEKPLGKSKPIQ